MNFEQMRKDACLTQVKLAVLVGVSVNTIQSWERGVSKPNEINYQKLLKALNVLPFTDKE